MTKKIVTPIKAPSTEAVYAASAIIGKMPEWRQVLKPLLDAAAKEFGQRKEIAPDVPKALDEFGRYCRTLGREIKQAQIKRAQEAIAPLPATEARLAPEPARQIGPRRVGAPPSSSPRPVGRPRKPAQRE